MLYNIILFGESAIWIIWVEDWLSDEHGSVWACFHRLWSVCRRRRLSLKMRVCLRRRDPLQCWRCVWRFLMILSGLMCVDDVHSPVSVSRVQRLQLKCVWSSRPIGLWKHVCCSRLLGRSRGLSIWRRRRRRRDWALTAGPSSPVYLLKYRSGLEVWLEVYWVSG